MANNSPQILPPAWRRWWSQEPARLCQSLTSCLVLKVVPPLRSLHVQSGRSCAWRSLQVRGTLPHTSLLGQPRTRLPQTPHCPFQQQVRIPEQVSVLPPEPCTHSTVRDPSSSPSSISVLVPSLQLFPQSSCIQVMLYSALFGLGNLRLRPQGIFGILLPFPHSHLCRLPTVVSSSSLFITVSAPPEPSQYFCSSSLMALTLRRCVSTSPICISHKPFFPPTALAWS